MPDVRGAGSTPAVPIPRMRKYIMLHGHTKTCEYSMCLSWPSFVDWWLGFKDIAV